MTHSPPLSPLSSSSSHTLIPSIDHIDEQSSTVECPTHAVSICEIDSTITTAYHTQPYSPSNSSVNATQIYPDDDTDSHCSTEPYASSSRSDSSSSRERPLTRSQRSNTSTITPSSSQNIHTESHQSTLSDDDLLMFLPSSDVPINTLISSISIPHWLINSMQPIGTGIKTRQSFSIAATLAILLHINSDLIHSPHSVESLITENSESFIIPPNGVDTHMVAVVKKMIIPNTSSHHSLTSISNLEKLDRSVRMLLRHINNNHINLAIIGRLYDQFISTNPNQLSPPPLQFSSLINSSSVQPPSHPATSSILNSTIQFPSFPSNLPLSNFTIPVEFIPTIIDAKIIPISGENNQCWYRCVGQALNFPSRKVKNSTLLFWDDIDTILRTTLTQITDPEILQSMFDITNTDTVTLQQINIIKQNYFNSRDFTEQSNGGSIEMTLLSYHYDHQIGFITIDNTPEPIKRFKPQTHPTREIALHHCAYQGGSTANHYNLFSYHLCDGSDTMIWNPSFESDPELSTRMNLLISTASDSAAATKKKYSKIIKEDEEIAKSLESILSTTSTSQKSPSKLPSKRATTSSLKPPITRHVTFIQAAAASSKKSTSNSTASISSTPTRKNSTTSTPSSSSSSRNYTPSSSRLNIWREIPSSCRNHFLALTSPMFERYSKLHSESDDNHTKRAELLNIILDLPSQALNKGGRVKELKQTLEQHMKIWKSYGEDNVELKPEENLSISFTHTPNIPIDTSDDSSHQNLQLPIDDSAIEVSDESSDIDSSSSHDSDDDPLTHQIKRAVNIVREGGPRALSRSARTLLQSSPAPIDESTITQLRNLHPQSTESMQPIPNNRAIDIVAIDQSALFKLLKNRVNNGSSPGPSGWSGSHLMLIADRGSDDAKNGITLLIKDICNGIFGGATQQRLLASILQPISKNGGSGIRPIAMGEVFVKLASHYSMSLIEKELPKLFPKIQYGVKRAGGSETAAQLTRAILNQSSSQHTDTIALKTDFQNAFNSASRSHIWRTLLKHPNTEPIWKMFYWAYSISSPLLVYDSRKLYSQLMSSEGVRQGDPFAAFAFALSVQSLYESSIDKLSDCHAISIQDDLTLIGPQSQVFIAYDRIASESKKYHLTLRVDKCAVYIPPTLINPSHTNTIITECNNRELQHYSHLESLGVVLGSDDAIHSHLESTVDSHDQLIKCLQHPSMSTQIALSILRYCAQPRLSFLARTTHPHNFQPSAKRFDEKILNCFREIMKLQKETKVKNVTQEEIETQISLPIKAGGFGLRPMTRISHAAYFASLTTILPDFIQSFPSSRISNIDYSQTNVHHELSYCRNHLHQQGVASKPQPKPSPSRKGKRGNPGVIIITPSIPQRRSSSQLSSSDSDTTKSSPLIQQILHDDISNLWKLAQKYIDDNDTKGFLEIASIQHEATNQIEDLIFKQLHQSSIPYRQALLTSLTAPHSSSWINVLPTQPTYTMPNESIRLATRHRLGLLPSDCIEHEKCVCRSLTRFIDDPDHFHSCEKFRRTYHTMRHNNIVQVVKDLAISVGFMAIIEPNSHVRPESIANLSASSEGYNIHGDLLLLKHDMKLYIDVVICRPTASHHFKSHPRVFDTPLYSTIIATKLKHKKYDEIAKVNDYRLFAFSMESYGGLGIESEKLLHLLASHSKEYTPVEFLRHAYRRLSCTLQSSNANIPLLAIQQLHLYRHSSSIGNYERTFRNRQESFGYSQPINSDHIMKYLESSETSLSHTEVKRRNYQLQNENDEEGNRSSTPTFIHDNQIGFADCQIIDHHYEEIDFNDQKYEVEVIHDSDNDIGISIAA